MRSRIAANNSRGTATSAISCFVDAGVNCACADVNGMNGVTLADVTVFVSDLLMGTGCP